MAFRREVSSVPTEKVLQLQSQGLSNDQIISALQREGYSTSDIFDALTQADLKKTIGEPISGIPEPDNPMRFTPVGVRGAIPSPPSIGESRTSVDKMEEIAEAIINEKWNALVESVNKIIDWKEKTEAEIASINTKIQHLNESFQQVQKSMMGRIEEYDRNMTDVGTDIKALTKVFQKILPGFMENVSELSRITSRIKGEVPKQIFEEKEAEDEGEIEEEAPRTKKRRSKSEEIFGETIEDIE